MTTNINDHVYFMLFQLQFNIHILNIHMTQFQLDRCQREGQQFNNCRLLMTYTKTMKLRDPSKQNWPEQFQVEFIQGCPGQICVSLIKLNDIEIVFWKGNYKIWLDHMQEKSKGWWPNWKTWSEIYICFESYHMNHMICAITLEILLYPAPKLICYC